MGGGRRGVVVVVVCVTDTNLFILHFNLLSDVTFKTPSPKAITLCSLAFCWVLWLTLWESPYTHLF